MSEENNRLFRVVFKEEFVLCLDQIERFFANQGSETLIIFGWIRPFDRRSFLSSESAIKGVRNLNSTAGEQNKPFSVTEEAA